METKKKNHIICFTCGERGHYHNNCSKKKVVNSKKPKGEWKKKVGYSRQGSVPTVKGKVILKISIQDLIFPCYVLFPIYNFGFRYHDRSRVNVHDNSKTKILNRTTLPEDRRVVGN